MGKRIPTRVKNIETQEKNRKKKSKRPGLNMENLVTRMGLIYTSRRILEQMHHLMQVLIEHGDPVMLLMQPGVAHRPAKKIQSHARQPRRRSPNQASFVVR